MGRLKTAFNSYNDTGFHERYRIGMKIRALVDSQNMAPGEFARKVNIAESSFAEYCNGKRMPPLATLLKIKTCYNDLDLDELLTK